MKILTIKQVEISLSDRVQMWGYKKSPHIHVAIKLIEIYYQSIW